jgi:arsenical resistance protein ArsH
VDYMENFVKYTIVMRPQFELFKDRFSAREEKHDRKIRSVTVENDIVDKT